MDSGNDCARLGGRIDIVMRPDAQKPFALKEFAAKMKESPLETKARLLTPGITPGSVQHPFPVTDREAYLAKVRGTGIFKRAESVKPSAVKLKDLTAIQRNVNQERLHAHLLNPRLIQPGTRAPGHGGIVDHPVVVKTGGKMFIHDGHHRCCSAHLRGQSEIQARVVDLDEGASVAHDSNDGD